MDASDAPQLHVFSNLTTAAQAAAAHLVDAVDRRLTTQDRFTLALAGGSTPRPLYEHLAADYRTRLPWNQIHLFWGDERYVPHDAPESNVRMAREALIDAVPIPDGHVHPMPTADAPDADAAAYAEMLHRFFGAGAPTFDLILLGLGGDGHTASLFPEDEQATATDDNLPWVRAVEAPPRHDVSTRLTCTLPAINRSREALFLVAGARKHDALQAVLDRRDPTLPPTHVRPREALHWFVDEAARHGA